MLDGGYSQISSVGSKHAASAKWARHYREGEIAQNTCCPSEEGMIPSFHGGS